MTDYPFSPTGATKALGAETTTANVEILSAWPKGGGVVRVTNVSDTEAFVAFGTSAITTAANTGMPILGNSAELFTVGEKETYAAGITAAGSADLYFTPGQGGV